MLVNEVQQEGSIDKDEGDLLKNAIELLPSRRRTDILIHRVDLAALPVDATKEEVADLFTQTQVFPAADLSRGTSTTLSAPYTRRTFMSAAA